jgi:hypothetical protein
VVQVERKRRKRRKRMRRRRMKQKKKKRRMKMCPVGRETTQCRSWIQAHRPAFGRVASADHAVSAEQ